MHGYEMMKALEEKSGGFYTPSPGSIYPTLQMLEDRGFVTSKDVEGKKVYSITDAGRALLTERQKNEEEFAGPPWMRQWGFGRHSRFAPEMQALKSEGMEVVRLLTIAGRMSFQDPEQLAKLRGVIKTELGDIRQKFASARRAEITFDPGEIDLEDLIEDEDLVVTLSRNGYVKSVAADAFRTQGRGGRGVQAAKLRDNDYVAHLLTTTAHSYLLFFSNRGKVYRLKAHEIPMKDRTARGTAIVNLLPLTPDERIAAVIDTRTYETGRYLFFATKKGQVKKTLMSEYDKSRREGFIAINLKDKDELVRVIQTGGENDIFMVSRNGQTIRFSEDAVRPMGRSAAGVIGMRLKQGDEVVSCDVARDDVDILIVTDAGYGKRTKLERFPRKGRGTMGVKGIKLTARRGYVVSAFMVGLDDEFLLISSAGVTIRTAARDVSSQGRDATGVRVMNLEKGQTVATAAPVLQVEEPE